VASSDGVIHIPPPDEEPPAGPRWVAPSLIGVGLAVIVLLVLQTRPLVPAYEWSTFRGPQGPVIIDSLVAVEDRFAVLTGVTEEGVSLLWSDGTGPWQSQLLEGSPNQLAAGEERLVAYRVRRGARLVPEGGRWILDAEIEFPEETRSRRASGRSSVVHIDEGLLMFSLFGNVWFSSAAGEFTPVIRDPEWGHGVERSFRSACRPPSRSSPDVPPLAIAEGTTFALVSSNPDEPFGIWPVCEPDTWASDDGVAWSVETTSLGDGGTYVYDVAWRDGLMVAVGGRGIDRPAVWASGDGVEWTDITPTANPSVVVDRVEAGEAGWVILGRDSLRSEPVGWTSRDGSCWEPLPTPIGGSEAVVTDDEILIVDLTLYPDMWLGAPTGSRGECR
jgi:hypothetical protein